MKLGTVDRLSSMELSSAASAVAETGGMGAGNWTVLGAALIALIGVVVSNIWSDHRQSNQLDEARKDRQKDQKVADERRDEVESLADKRREEDQKSADDRRQADQRAAEKQRGEDIERAEAVRQQERQDRELERLEEVGKAERDRQRRAVAGCLDKITTSARRTQTLSAKKILDSQTDLDIYDARMVKAITLTEFYQDSANALSILDLELNDERVREPVEELWSLIADYSEALQEESDESTEAWLKASDDTVALTEPILRGIRKLQITARLFFLQYPDPVRKSSTEDNSH